MNIYQEKNQLQKKKSKQENDNKDNNSINNSNNKIQYLFYYQPKRINKNNILFGILFFLSYYIYSILCDIFINSKKELTKLGTNEYYNALDIFYLYLIFRFKHKTIFYRHHNLSLFILLFVLLLLYFLKLFLFKDITFDYPDDLICLISLIIFPLFDSYQNYFLKYIMMYYYFSPFLVCFLMGSINISLSLILLIIFINIDCGNSVVCLAISEIQNISGYAILLYILKSFINSVIFFLRLLVMNEYSLFHIIILFIFLLLGNDIVGFFVDPPKYTQIIITIISFIIEFFFLFVLFEIIELNFCGLNHNLRKNIITRSEDETNHLFLVGSVDFDGDNETNIELVKVKEDDKYN